MKLNKSTFIKTICISLLILFCISLTACLSSEKKIEYVKSITKIDEYFYEIDTYESLNFEASKKYFAEKYDNWGGGCSAVSAVIDGKRLVARNMDLNISNKCAYVVRTNLTNSNPNTYKTVGLAYTFRDVSLDYNTVQEKGITKEFYDIAPFLCDDVMNSEGLHIELNMRNAECWPNGMDIFSVNHTNYDSKERIYMFELPQYIALNCKTLAEAKEYVKTLDIYSKEGYWNYAYIITDALGNSSLLEICFPYNEMFGNIFWTDAVGDAPIAQTNFYVNELAQKCQDTKTGKGRYDTIMADIGSITTRVGLYELMKKIQFSSYYLPYKECKTNHFDPRGENIGTYYGTTYTVMTMDEFEPICEEVLDYLNEEYRTLSRQQKQDRNEYWESTFTELVDPQEKTIQVRLFENDSMLYKLTIDTIEKITEIK